jgi:hypothetical protein
MAVTTMKGPIGIQFGNVEAKLYNRTGGDLVAGDLVALNLYLTGSETTTYGYGLATSGFANVTVSCDGSNTLGGTIYAIATEAVLDDALGNFMFSGTTTVATIAGTTEAAGQPLWADPEAAKGFSNLVTDLDNTDDAKVIGILLDTATNTVLFDGIHGFGGEMITTVGA